jgi:nuclear pore complex protein Nup93
MSSIFGAPGPKPSLFQTSSTSTPQLGGLSSSSNTTQPATTTSSLFGSLGAASQPQQSGTGLFSSLGLGGNSQPQQQQQQSGGGLFNTKPAQQQQQQPGFGLFPNQSQTGGSTLGGASQTGHQGSFNASAASQSQNQQNGEPSTYFDTILEKSRKRALGETAEQDLPQLQLGLGDLRQRIKRFTPGKTDKVVDGRAHYLLAASGVDPGAAIRDLNLFSSGLKKAEQPQPQEATDTDVESYLANLQTQTTLKMISDGLARSVRDFDTFLEDKVTLEWDAQRKRIYQHFGIKQREDTTTPGRSGFGASESEGAFGRSRRTKAAALAGSQGSKTPAGSAFGGSAFGKSGLQKSVIGPAAPVGSTFKPLFSDIEKRMETNGIPVPDPNDRFQRERQGRLAEKVQKLNEARLGKCCFPLLHELRDAVQSGGEEHSTEIVKAYRAVIEMVEEDEEVVDPASPLARKERQFAEDYLDETPNSVKQVEMKRRIIRGSCRFLENIFFDDLDAYIKKSPKEANLGGVPDVLSKVRAYVRLRAARKDLVPDNTDLQMLNDDYVWALCYYLLRAGQVKELSDYVTANMVPFRAIDRNFVNYVSDYHRSHDRRLNRDNKDQITKQYNQHLRIAPEGSIDPFKMACYKIIGRCDLKNRALESSIHQSMEDYMWLQFILAREGPQLTELASEAYNLATAQSVIKEIGSRFFSKGENYGSYFYIQVLGGMFEEAIEYLYPYSYPDAVHFAIALDYYGLLRVSDPELLGDTSLLSLTTRGLPQIKFGHMIGHYTRDFRAANVSAAVDYLTLICLNRDLPGQHGRNQARLCHEALRELVLESREFAQLLGDVRNDGQRIKGIIEERMGLIALDETDDFMRTITVQAASVADDNGRVTDAVLLYHLAGEYDNVVVIINRAMSEGLSVQMGQDQMRLQPMKPRAISDNRQVQSLSLVSIDDPVNLGRAMSSLYEQSNMYRSRIKQSSRDDLKALLAASVAKEHLERESWGDTLDVSLVLSLVHDLIC